MPANMFRRLAWLAAMVAILPACSATPVEPVALPPPLAGKAEVIQPGAPGYDQANRAAAVKPAGQGGVSEGLVVRITQPVTLYRLWSGPQAVNAQGQTNRLGQWWSYDAPAGTRDRYRVAYEVCRDWNELTWVATCTLRPGATVVVGPGQSVSQETCQRSGESYPADPVWWQTYVDKAWARPQELDCPDAASDYAADPADIARALASPAR